MAWLRMFWRDPSRRPVNAAPPPGTAPFTPARGSDSHHPVPSEEQIGRVFQNLANQHSIDRSRLTREADWRRIRGKWHERLRRRPWLLRISWPQRLALAGVMCGALAALMLTPKLLWPPAPPLTYALRGDEAALGVEFDDGWVKTGESGAALDFSDGSQVELGSHTALTVNVMGEHSAWTRINSGRLSAKVHHAATTQWSFFAGPYEVRVVGTAFDLSWGDAGLRVSMHEGEVNVIGPEQQRWVLRQGEELSLPGPTPSSAVADSADPDSADPDSADPDSADPDSADPDSDMQPPDLSVEASRIGGDGTAGAQRTGSLDSSTSRASSAPGSPKSAVRSAEDWSQLLAKGRFSEVVQAAKVRGLEASLQRAPAKEIAALAQAATYTGETKLAEQSWLTLRKRFAGSERASRGAFYLARIKDQQGQSGEAIRWLDTYLSEAPGGAFVAETLGRKLVLTRRLHGATSAPARRLARDYLKRFPQGAYVETARATLAHR